ncbi:MAG: cupin domain-containing protein [Dehalococcoidia bacterium]|nr:cupin domain-containing protein [Dehalococcoidia bacterium]
MERELTKTQEAEAQIPIYYEVTRSLAAKAKQQALEGRIVIRGKEQPWQQSRQARVKSFLHAAITDTALLGWLFFVQDIRTHSGRHRHQGGLAIYVLEGKGWTTVDSVRHDWEEGDLILLPLKPEGVVHQHFNAAPGSPCKWLALIYLPFFIEALCTEVEQKEVSPDWAHV